MSRIGRRGFLGAAAAFAFNSLNNAGAQDETPKKPFPVKTVSSNSVDYVSRKPLDFTSLKADDTITEINDLTPVVLQMMNLTEKQSQKIRFPKDVQLRAIYAHNIVTSIVGSPNKSQIDNIKEYFNRLDWAICSEAISPGELQSIYNKPNQMAISNGILQLINGKPKNPRNFFRSVLEYAEVPDRGSSNTLSAIKELVAKE